MVGCPHDEKAAEQSASAKPVRPLHGSRQEHLQSPQTRSAKDQSRIETEACQAEIEVSNDDLAFYIGLIVGSLGVLIIYGIIRHKRKSKPPLRK